MGICAVCGKELPPRSRFGHDRIYCSKRCKAKAWRKSLRDFQRQVDEEKFMRRARMAKRDLEYAESPCAAKVTVEERNVSGCVMRIETRGRVCIAPKSGFISL